MSTAPLMTDSPLALLVEANASPRAAAADPYARWHGFMEGVVRNWRGVAGVATVLACTAAQPVWSPPGLRLGKPAGRRRR